MGTGDPTEAGSADQKMIQEILRKYKGKSFPATTDREVTVSGIIWA